MKATTKKAPTMTTTAATPGDDGYEDFLGAIRERFDLATKGEPPLFTTDASGLWDAFVGGLPADRRQHYACNACKRFVETHGGLVTIDGEGDAVSVVWPAEVPEFFRTSVARIAAIVRRAKVTGAYLSEERRWGIPTTHVKATGHDWHHMAVIPAPALVFRPTAIHNAGQLMADKRGDFSIVSRGLAEFSVDVVRQAHAILNAEALYRSEKVIGPAAWLLALHERVGGLKGARRDNALWVAVAKAPPGFCHVRSTMIGTLLEDIGAGLSFDDVKRKFAAKMDPTKYLRPTAAPSDGNIAQAEKIIATMRAAGSLERRFARLEDLTLLWRPAPPKPSTPAGAGVFGHLKGQTKPSAPVMAMPPVTMTWVKFEREVLPLAESMEVEVPSHGSFLAFVTAKNPDAPRIFQWDNHVTHYVYRNGSLASQWNLRGGARTKVTGLARGAAEWAEGGGFDHQGKAVTFVLEGARDTAHRQGGGFFPEQLRAEFHGVRRTIETHVTGATIEGRDEATACGLTIQKGSAANVTVHVVAKGTALAYRIDRWD